MTVLVTGASGFIGRCAVRRLAAEGWQVVAAVRGGDPVFPEGVLTETVDLLQPGAAVALAERTRATHLLHLAWNTQVGRFWTASDNLDWTAASLLLLRAFAEAGGRRAVMAGTCAEYDWTGPGRLDESAPARPATFYGASKDALRRLACAAAAPLSLSVAWGRVFWLYGPGEAAGRLVSDVARALAEGRPVETTEGLQRRDFLHVDDVAGAFVAALTSDWSGPFNIGSGRAAPIRELVEGLAAAAGRPDLVRLGARPTQWGEAPIVEADPRVLNTRVGYTPAIPLALGLAQTYDWWRSRSSPTS